MGYRDGQFKSLSSRPFLYNIIIPHTGLIVSLELVKKQLNIDITNTDDDELLTLYINTAHEIIENFTRRDYLLRTYATFRDRWDYVGFCAYHPTFDSKNFLLTKSEITAFSTLEYLKDNLLVTVDPSVYYTSKDEDYMRILLRPNHLWPVDKDHILGSIKMTFVCGIDPVPAMIQNVAMMLVTYSYANRGDCGDCGAGMASLIQADPQIATILKQNRILRV